MSFRDVTIVLTAICSTFVGCGRQFDDPETIEPETVVSVTDASSPAEFPDEPADDQADNGSPTTTAGARPEKSPSTGDLNDQNVKQSASDVPGFDSSNRYRLPRLRPIPSDESLRPHGLKALRSKRLVLITDADSSAMANDPDIADQLFNALQRVFGKLPEATDGSDFVVVGHVMKDRSVFRKAGLLPDARYEVRHGRHVRYCFWMNDQDSTYYRRHLLLHEFVHCFMLCKTSENNIPPLWYVEGMAELFGTHSASAKGADAAFGVMPDRPDSFTGWGRIRALRDPFAVGDYRDVKRLPVKTLSQVTPDITDVFEGASDYACAWAFCWLLHHHPEYSERVQPLRSLKTRTDFLLKWQSIRNDIQNRLAIDWLLFCESVNFGFDAERSFPVWQNAHADSRTLPENSVVVANRGWQDSGVILAANEPILVTAEGWSEVDRTTRPWMSTPDGLTVRYIRGHPIGCLVGIVTSTDGTQISDRIRIGRAATVASEFQGRLWLQISDDCSSRANNSGQYSVQLQPADAE